MTLPGPRCPSRAHSGVSRPWNWGEAKEEPPLLLGGERNMLSSGGESRDCDRPSSSFGSLIGVTVVEKGGLGVRSW